MTAALAVIVSPANIVGLTVFNATTAAEGVIDKSSKSMEALADVTATAAALVAVSDPNTTVGATAA